MPRMMADRFDEAFTPRASLRDIEAQKDALERKLFLAPLPFDAESERYCANLRRQIDELEDELEVGVQ